MLCCKIILKQKVNNVINKCHFSAFRRILGLFRLFTFGKTAKILGFCLVFLGGKYPGPEVTFYNYCRRAIKAPTSPR
jgi:hypothetical protein